MEWPLVKAKSQIPSPQYLIAWGTERRSPQTVVPLQPWEQPQDWGSEKENANWQGHLCHAVGRESHFQGRLGIYQGMTDGKMCAKISPGSRPDILWKLGTKTAWRCSHYSLLWAMGFRGCPRHCEGILSHFCGADCAGKDTHPYYPHSP